MDEAREAAVTAYLAKFGWDDWIGRDECGIDFRAGWNAALDWAQDQQDQQEPFTPGQYRQARGIAPPDEGQPAAAETIRAMRDEP